MMFRDPAVDSQISAEWKEMTEAAKKGFNDRAAKENDTKKAVDGAGMAEGDEEEKAADMDVDADAAAEPEQKGEEPAQEE
jgi:hypothetical protein